MKRFSIFHFPHLPLVKDSSGQTFSISRGFTLIELLVTIAIIGILSSILLVNLQGFRERTRDIQRKRDLHEIQTVLELYRSDVSSYPAALPNCGSSLTNGSTVYMQKIPCDPLTNNKYSYSLAGNVYTMTACLENINDSEKDATTQGGCGIASKTVQTL
jgi:prepilin-type N-terminal cleavage/methylation domain-containing protein